MMIKQLKNGKQLYKNDKPLKLTCGVELMDLNIAFETFGSLNTSKTNAICIIHALSTNSHVCANEDDPCPGWWENMVGPGCPIDTNYYFVICANNLGSCFGSTGPVSINPKTGDYYRANFPNISIADMATALEILREALSIASYYAVISPSMGGMIGLSWAVHYPNAMQRLISISSCHMSFAANIAFRNIAREIIELDPKYNDGNYQEKYLLGFEIARKIGHLFYRNPAALNQKFNGLNDSDDQKGNIIDYLKYNAHKFIESFDANSFIKLTKAMDSFTIAEGFINAKAALANITAVVTVVSVTSDLLFPVTQQQQLFDLLISANISSDFQLITSDYGHDAFLVEIEPIGKAIQQALLR